MSEIYFVMAIFSAKTKRVNTHLRKNVFVIYSRNYKTIIFQGPIWPQRMISLQVRFTIVYPFPRAHKLLGHLVKHVSYENMKRNKYSITMQN